MAPKCPSATWPPFLSASLCHQTTYPGPPLWQLSFHQTWPFRIDGAWVTVTELCWQASRWMILAATFGVWVVLGSFRGLMWSSSCFPYRSLSSLRTLNPADWSIINRIWGHLLYESGRLWWQVFLITYQLLIRAERLLYWPCGRDFWPCPQRKHVCHSLLIWGNRLGHLLTPRAEVKCPNTWLVHSLRMKQRCPLNIWLTNRITITNLSDTGWLLNVLFCLKPGMSKNFWVCVFLVSVFLSYLQRSVRALLQRLCLLPSSPKSPASQLFVIIRDLCFQHTDNSETEGLDVYWDAVARNANVRKQRSTKSLYLFHKMTKSLWGVCGCVGEEPCGSFVILVWPRVLSYTLTSHKSNFLMKYLPLNLEKLSSEWRHD